MLAEASDDNYSDDYEEGGFEDADDDEADKKLENLRKAMAREANNAQKVVIKHVNRKPAEENKPLLKMGP